MVNRKDIIHIIIAIILMSFLIGFTKGQLDMINLAKGLIFSIIIILISILGKEISANALEIKIKHRILQLQRYGFAEKMHFKKPIPFGFILPLLLAVISGGAIKMLTILQFDAKPKSSRITKKYGSKRYFELKESDFALIAFYGIVAVLLLSIISKWAGSIELARYSLYYVALNLIPFGQLDGMKLLIGSSGPGYKTNAKKITAPLYIFAIFLTIITVLIVLL